MKRTNLHSDWFCDLCGQFNSDYDTFCVCCSAPKPSLKPNNAKSSEKQSVSVIISHLFAVKPKENEKNF